MIRKGGQDPGLEIVLTKSATETNIVDLDLKKKIKGMRNDKKDGRGNFNSVIALCVVQLV